MFGFLGKESGLVWGTLEERNEERNEEERGEKKGVPQGLFGKK